VINVVILVQVMHLPRALGLKNRVYLELFEVHFHTYNLHCFALDAGLDCVWVIASRTRTKVQNAVCSRQKIGVVDPESLDCFGVQNRLVVRGRPKRVVRVFVHSLKISRGVRPGFKAWRVA